VTITMAAGTFSVVLGLIYGFAAFSEYRAAQHQWTIKARIRRRMAVILTAVGLSLISWQRFFSK
jgi:hypothetical protein